MTAPTTPTPAEERAAEVVERWKQGDVSIPDGGSRVTATEIGLQGWFIEGWRTYGATYGKALAFAQQEMRKAMERGVDPITHEPKPKADPLGALERIVYDLLVIAVEGLPAVAEMPPIPETLWTEKKPPTRLQLVMGILHDLLMETDTARLTKDGVAYAAIPGYGVHTWSTPALRRAVERLEALPPEVPV